MNKAELKSSICSSNLHPPSSMSLLIRIIVQRSSFCQLMGTEENGMPFSSTIFHITTDHTRNGYWHRVTDSPKSEVSFPDLIRSPDAAYLSENIFIKVYDQTILSKRGINSPGENHIPSVLFPAHQCLRPTISPSPVSTLYFGCKVDYEFFIAYSLQWKLFLSICPLLICLCLISSS